MLLMEIAKTVLFRSNPMVLLLSAAHDNGYSTSAASNWAGLKKQQRARATPMLETNDEIRGPAHHQDHLLCHFISCIGVVCCDLLFLD